MKINVIITADETGRVQINSNTPDVRAVLQIIGAGLQIMGTNMAPVEQSKLIVPESAIPTPEDIINSKGVNPPHGT